MTSPYVPVEVSGAPEANVEASGQAGLIDTAKNVSSRPQCLSKRVEQHNQEAQRRLRARERSRQRYSLREVLWSESTLKRCRSCGRRRISADEPIAIKSQEYDDGHRGAHYSNLQSCGSIWACPICAAKIRQRRAEEIERGVLTHLSNGGGVEFLTLTLPHHEGDRLKPLLQATSKAFRRVLGGGGWKKDQGEYSVVGTIRTTEITHGASSWHPHLHVLIFTERRLSELERDALQKRLYGRWARTVQGCGYQRPLPGLCPMKPVFNAEGMAEYLTKVVLSEDENGRRRRIGLEMARHDLKAGRESSSRGFGPGGRNRTPWEVLRDFEQTGDEDELELWREYEQATKGKQAMAWSKGLKALLLVEEKSDEELAEEEVGGEVEVLIPLVAWRHITQERGAVGRLRELVEEGRADVVRAMVQVYVMGERPPPWMEVLMGAA